VGVHRHTTDADVAVVEGVMGLYDSRDGASDDGSTAQVLPALPARCGPVSLTHESRWATQGSHVAGHVVSHAHTMALVAQRTLLLVCRVCWQPQAVSASCWVYMQAGALGLAGCIAAQMHSCSALFEAS
jgi:hypothetical protein